MVRLALLVSLVVVAPVAFGHSGIVSKVIDGDTIEVHGHTVLLQGIDAPERDQPHGVEAAEALREFVLNHEVRLEVEGIDRYSRLIAQVYIRSRNVNRWLVRNGHAWEYNRYGQDRALGRLEHQAREKGRGLWAAREPIPPWQWRDRPASLPDTADRDCSDFDTRAQAQRFFERHQPGDPHRLDRNGDGRACTTRSE